MKLLNLITWRRKAHIKPGPIAQLTNGPGKYDVDIVGESYYQDALEGLCDGKKNYSQRLETIAVLILENENKYDPKSVLVSIDNLPVGHLDRETAKSFRKQVYKAAPGVDKIAVKAIIVGGWDRGGGDRGHFGVKLDIPLS